MSSTCRIITREIPRVVARPIMCKINNDLHGKCLRFTRENTHDTTRGMSCVCKVVVELYRMLIVRNINSLLTQLFEAITFIKMNGMHP